MDIRVAYSNQLRPAVVLPAQARRYAPPDPPLPHSSHRNDRPSPWALVRDQRHVLGGVNAFREASFDTPTKLRYLGLSTKILALCGREHELDLESSVIRDAEFCGATIELGDLAHD